MSIFSNDGFKGVSDAQVQVSPEDESNMDQCFNTSEADEISVWGPPAIEELPSTPLEPSPSMAIPNGKNVSSRKKKLFGLKKDSPSDKPSRSASTFNPFDYEQKYPKDRFGEEWGPNARIWLTYLDEADAYDRNKVEGWRDTVDVLLVFTGLFSAVVTTFVAQSFQSLQPDFAQVSASLLFEMVQLQRAQITGVPISDVPNSTLTPASPFNPSATASLVNGLWFTSLAISLSTALFSVVAKQWLYYFISTVSGTARDKARVRHFRFQGLDVWKVGFIIDLLPILIHLALCLFLIGLIILVFPLDIRIGWTITILSGMTYVFYFTSAALPIRYAECPYTTSLTIFMGVMYHFLASIFFKIVGRYKRMLRFILRFIDGLGQYLTGFPAAPNHTIRVLESSFRKTEQFSFEEAISVQRILGDAINNPPVATHWRERKLEESVKAKEWLNIHAVHWLYTISTNPSIQRIIARCVGVYPELIGESGVRFCRPTLAHCLVPDEANVEDYGHVLSLRVPLNKGFIDSDFFKLTATAIAGVSVNRTEEVYSCIEIARGVVQNDYVDILLQAFDDSKFRAPLAVWDHLLSSARKNVKLAARILCTKLNPFDWSDGIVDDNSPSDGSTLLSVSGGTSSKSLRKLGFKYLAGCFSDDRSSFSIEEDVFFENRYNLFIAIYRNLTSDQSFIEDAGLAESCLVGLFNDLEQVIRRASLSRLTEWFASWEHPNRFTREVLCVDACWGDRMPEAAQQIALNAFDALWDRHIESTKDVLSFLLTNDDQELRSIYRRCSEQPSDTLQDSHLVLQLFLPQNIENLITILREEPANRAITNFQHCLKRLREVPWACGAEKYVVLERNYIIPNLLHLFKTMSPSHPLHYILYDKLILVQLWAYFDHHMTTSRSAKDFFPIIKSRFDRQDLKELYQLMVDEMLSDGNPNTLRSAYKLGRSIGLHTSELRLPISKYISSFWNLSNDEDLESRVTENIELFNWQLEEKKQQCSPSWSDLIVRVRQKFKKSSPARPSDSGIEV